MSTKVILAICGCLLVAGVTVFLLVHLVTNRNELETQETMWHEMETSIVMESESVNSTETVKVVRDVINEMDESLPEDGDVKILNIPEVNDDKELNDSSTDVPVTELNESSTEIIGVRLGDPNTYDISENPPGGDVFGAKFGVIVAPVTCDPPKRLDPISRRCRLNI